VNVAAGTLLKSSCW